MSYLLRTPNFNPNKLDKNGIMPLYLALAHPDAKMALILLESGADLQKGPLDIKEIIDYMCEEILQEFTTFHTRSNKQKSKSSFATLFNPSTKSNPLMNFSLELPSQEDFYKFMKEYYRSPFKYQMRMY